jgi:hypothetical protein
VPWHSTHENWRHFIASNFLALGPSSPLPIVSNEVSRLTFHVLLLFTDGASVISTEKSSIYTVLNRTRALSSNVFTDFLDSFSLSFVTTQNPMMNLVEDDNTLAV